MTNENSLKAFSRAALGRVQHGHKHHPTQPGTPNAFHKAD